MESWGRDTRRDRRIGGWEDGRMGGWEESSKMEAGRRKLETESNE